MSIALSALTLGTSGLGRGTAPGSREEAAAVATAIALFDSGHAFLDTSNNYAGGRSEAVISRAIAERGGDSADRVITKVDSDGETGVFDRDRVLRSYEESLSRLGVDRVALLHLHDPFTISFDEAAAPGGAIEEMRELKESGAVDAIGVAAGPVPLMQRYVDTGVFDAVLCHNRLTLVDRSAQSLFESARARGMTVFNAAPYGAGLLASGPKPGASYGYRPASDALLEWTAAAEALCQEHGVSLGDAALRFSLRSPLVDSTVVGVSSAGRLAELDRRVAVQVPAELWAAIDALGPAPSTIDDSEYV
ncbi:aldo/keto reductase [Microbacterium sp. ARD31]|uniref:aldo/keto reductase n=1 Tax=Microbacterium sp. ARD31 TaxID=2962576 RepID=UPI0028819D3A|nr:aldo/keto reductase [Microbacterium sp. ARD31]MDT0180567.1 aldo/keto reductase [Microbacterium sp. ARD31]